MHKAYIKVNEFVLRWYKKLIFLILKLLGSLNSLFHSKFIFVAVVLILGSVLSK